LSRAISVRANFALIRASPAQRALKSSTTAVIALLPPKRSKRELPTSTPPQVRPEGYIRDGAVYSDSLTLTPRHALPPALAPRCRRRRWGLGYQHGGALLHPDLRHPRRISLRRRGSASRGGGCGPGA